MSQDPNQNNDENKDEIIDENEQIIRRTNEMLENINRTFRINSRNSRNRHLESLLSELNPENPLNQMIIHNSENLDRVLETRRNLRNELETTRCNYVLSVNRFCTRRKTSGSDYCVYHSNEFNGVNYGMGEMANGRPYRLPVIPHRQLSHIQLSQRARARSLDISLPNLDVSSTSDLTSSLEIPSSNLNPNLDISSTSSLQDLNTTSVSSSNPNISIEISNLDPDINLNQRIRLSNFTNYGVPILRRRIYRLANGDIIDRRASCRERV